MRNAILPLCLFLLLGFSPQLLTAREWTTLQTGWKFKLGPVEKAADPKLNDAGWQNVSVPHDWAIAGPMLENGDGNTGKLPWKGEGWYRKALELPASAAGKSIYLLFDGILSSPEVFVNGQLAGKWDYGYNSFFLDVTKFVKPGGKNLLAIHADTRNHDSRWYPGAGIYRKVQMLVVDPLHVPIWGVQVTTPVIKPNYAETRVITTVRNQQLQGTEKVRVETTILSPSGLPLTSKSGTALLKSGTESTVETTIGLTDPKRWDIEHPVLYKVKTRIFRGNLAVDSCLTDFGIRTIRFTADHGMYLNDKRVQLKGVNLHHDQGPLGAAFYPRAMERQIGIMQSMGCNAIRTSHNMAAPELYELCDKMGMLVFDEAFDKYDKKADIEEDTDFEEFAGRNIRNFVLRDRNHPCIFIWSVGNEMGDVQTNRDQGIRKMQTMINYVRKYDPTRPVTMACDITQGALLRHFDYYDVHSWNYMRRYSLARQMEPSKAVIVSESGSTVSTRGYYELPLPVKRSEFSPSLQVSSYDLNVPEWADLPDEDFMWQQDEPYIAGEFVWTGFDYLGEPTPYRNDWTKAHGMTDKEASRSSYFGIVDLCGIPKDRYYLYKSFWKPEETTVHILPHWNWEGSKTSKIPVFVYTNGDAAELFLNGKSLGKKSKQPNSAIAVDRFRLSWPDVEWQAGELKAVAWKEGVVVGEGSIKTAGKAQRLRITPDRSALKAGGMDLSYILLEAVDGEGNICPLATVQVSVSIDGPGNIAGIANGDPQSKESFCSSRISLFYGKAMLIVGTNLQKGDIRVTATADGLAQDTKILKVE